MLDESIRIIILYSYYLMPYVLLSNCTQRQWEATSAASNTSLDDITVYLSACYGSDAVAWLAQPIPVILSLLIHIILLRGYWTRWWNNLKKMIAISINVLNRSCTARWGVHTQNGGVVINTKQSPENEETNVVHACKTGDSLWWIDARWMCRAVMQWPTVGHQPLRHAGGVNEF